MHWRHFWSFKRKLGRLCTLLKPSNLSNRLAANSGGTPVNDAVPPRELERRPSSVPHITSSLPASLYTLPEHTTLESLYAKMALPFGLFLGGCVVAIPVVTGVAEGVSHQKKQNEEAANETRMIKFNIHISCDSEDELADEIDDGIVVLRHNKV
jgi:hypothetical protein